MTRARDMNRIRLRREDQGLLLVELAAKIARSPAMLSGVEGGFVPQRGTQRKIAEALETTPEDLWPEEYA